MVVEDRLAGARDGTGGREAAGVEPVVAVHGELLAALRWLDGLLAAALEVAQRTYGVTPGSDPYRGLYIGHADIERLLSQEPGAFSVTPDPTGLPDLAEPGSRLAWLASAFELDRFDLALLIIALAPEVDLRYERLFGFLQDDVTRRRPSLDLALGLLCQTAEERLRRRAHVAPDSPLLRHGLLGLVADSVYQRPPLLGHALVPDQQTVRFLLGESGLSPRLATFCRLVEPAGEAPLLDTLDGAAHRALGDLAAQAWHAGRPLRLYFHGPSGVGKQRTAASVARRLDAHLLVADLGRAEAEPGQFAQAVACLLREAWFRGAVPYLRGIDALRAEGRPDRLAVLFEALVEDAGVVILAGARPWVPEDAPDGVLVVPFERPGFARRRACWAQSLGGGVDSATLDTLAGRFSLTERQIASAAAAAQVSARWRGLAAPTDRLTLPTNPTPTRAELFAAARAQTGHDLATLARKLEPRHGWADLILPADSVTQLRELCQRVAQHERVFGTWGFGRKLTLGTGVTALFGGPSGTGKTMAAQVIAGELGLDLFSIDLSRIVSKYIGETEKNLDRVFTAAEHANAILFFDEADALFGKRSEVRDSHDRYANVEISYLLQKMEEYAGIAILATNLRQHLDDAFTRRLAFTISFPFPDESHRRRIWEVIWPPEAPLGADVDLGLLAREVKLAGGGIKNVALAAAFLAAEDGTPIRMVHLARAARREYQKLGRPTGTDVLEVGPDNVAASMQAAGPPEEPVP